MRLFFRLLSVQLNQRFGLSATRTLFKENKKRAAGRAALGVVIALSLSALVGMYTWLLVKLMPSFQALGLEVLMLGGMLLASMVLVFFLGMIYLLGVLFFSKDTEFLAALPIPERTVFAAKFSQVLLGEIASSAVILLPSFIVYGVMTNAGALYWVLAVIALPLAPCIPLALSALASLLLMRCNALWRRRDLMTVIGSVMLLVAIMAGQMLLTSKMPDTMDTEKLMELVSNSSYALRMAVSVFPPSGWAAEGMTGKPVQFVLFAAVSFAALALVMWAAGRLYYSGAKAQLETSAKGRHVELSGAVMRRRSAIGSLFAREWRTVLRSPVYVLNGLIAIVLGPLMLILFKFMPGASSGGAEMDALFALLEGTADTRLILLILAGLFMVIGTLNPAVTTSVSREGKGFYLMRIIPVTSFRQVGAKFLFGVSVSGLAMLMMSVVSVMVMGFSWQVVLQAFALGLLGSVAPMALSMIPDVLRPKLLWNSETEAIKQNMNSILGMVIGWGYIALLGFASFKMVEGGMGMGMLLGVLVG
ncbi:MAG: hypothetical protein FWF69_02680, partial [Firmicutes bacterium]|nr:hypothetical protein [Bacillota bacterium]